MTMVKLTEALTGKRGVNELAINLQILGAS